MRCRKVISVFLICACLVATGAVTTQTESQAKPKYYKIEGQWVGFEKSKGRLTWAPISYVPKKIDGTKVKIIGKWAFSGNKKIKTAKIPSSVTKIEKGAFYGCPKLTKVVFPKKKIKMGDIEDNRIFWESNKIKTVVNNPDKKWKQRIKTFTDTLKYLNKRDPYYYVENVRSFKNQWIVDEDGNRVDYTDEAWEVVRKKAQALSEGCSTAMEKAKKISKWIVKYLHYDDKWMEAFQEWRKTHDENTEEFPLKKVTDAYGLITWDPAEHDGETAMTTCGGYGNLTQALFCAAGIPCVHVHRVQKKGESIDHVFNVAYIGGRWVWLDNTYSDKTLDYFDCYPAGMSASDHRCDRLNLEYLSDLTKSSKSILSKKTGDDSDTEQINIDGEYWTINRKTDTIVRFPWKWEGTEIPTEIDGMPVKKIGDYACGERENLRELVIPESVTQIGEGAFRYNHRLKKLTVGSKVKKIGDYAFQNCDELNSIKYKGKQKKIKFGNYAFRGCLFLHPDFSKSYKKGIYYKQLHEVDLSGEFVKDMLAIGKSQLGYHHGNDETEMHGYNKLGGEYYSEYNYFSGLPDWQWGMKDYVKQSDYKWGYGGWCGNYCEWCISMAGIPAECTAYCGRLDSVKWKDTVYAGGNYEIKAGDVLHFSAGHYCLVVSVKSAGKKVKIKTLNGNPNVAWHTYVLNKKDGSNDESHNYDIREILPIDVSKAKDVKAFTVSFDTQGGKGGTASKTVYEGACYGVLPKPTKAAYTFDGWYTDKEGGEKITSYRNVWLDGDITVYAHWILGDEPAYMNIDTYVSHAPKESSIEKQFARIYIEKSTFSYKTLKKKSLKTWVKRKNGKGKITCKNVTKGKRKKYIKLGKNGAVTIKKGAPRGRYDIFVTVAKYKTVNMSQSTVTITVK